MTTGSRIASIGVMLGLALVPSVARAFPPYRSTDADTASPWTLESRTGLLVYERDDGQDAHTMPLLRLNLGLPRHVEILGETEWDADAGEVGEAALGGKGILFFGPTSVGVEMLGLLPISSEGGAGVECLALITLRPSPFHVHVNVGGFYDTRATVAESGWKESVLVELPGDRLRPGIELASERVSDAEVDVRAGAGVIVDFGTLQLRTGVHAGLTDAAPDLRINVWISTETDFANPAAPGSASPDAGDRHR